MHALKRLALALALFQGGWFVFDSSRALIVGDYITPASGPYAGRLGPWAKVISALGLEPRSTVVKCGLLVLGLAWLAGLPVFAGRPASGRASSWAAPSPVCGICPLAPSPASWSSHFCSRRTFVICGDRG